jgi:hypothetical protein
LSQTLEEQLHSIVLQQAQDARDQSNGLNRVLDSKTQELFKAQASFADLSQRHIALQSQYSSKSPLPNLNRISFVTARSLSRLD